MCAAEITLRVATLEDAGYLFLCRTDPETVRQSDGHAPSLNEHLAWLTENIRNDRRAIYVAELEGKDIGTGRLDLHNGSVELSWTVAPINRGRGLAAPLILALREAAQLRWPGIKQVARVKASNTPSLRAALAAGLRSTSDTLLMLEAL